MKNYRVQIIPPRRDRLQNENCKLKSKFVIGFFVICNLQFAICNWCYSDLPTAQFLLIGQGARAEALGQSVVSNCFDFTSVYWNPAATAFLPKTEVGFNHSALPAEIYSNFLGVAIPYKKCGFGFRFFGEETNMTTFDNVGAKHQDIQTNNKNINFIFAYKFVDSFSLGVGVGSTEMASGDMPGGGRISGSGGNLNIGAIYKNDRFSAGFAAANLGGEINYKGYNSMETMEPQPSLVRAGISLLLLKDKNLLLTASIKKVNEDPNAGGVGFGCEYIPVKYIALRFGIKKQNDNTVASPSLGFGVYYNWFALDYAYTPSMEDTGLMQINKVSLSARIGKSGKKEAKTEGVKPTEVQVVKPERKPGEIQNIAVADFGGKNVSQADASIVTDFLRTELVNSGAYNVIEKANMDKILAEAAFQQSGCTTSECAVQIGKLLNVRRMVVGSLSKLVDTYYITVNMVEVETGKIVASYDQEAMSAKELRTACKTLAEKLAW